MNYSGTFNNKEEARQWALKQNINAKKFAAQNDLWCYTITTLDEFTFRHLNSRSVYAEDRVDIEESYSATMRNLNDYGISYYVTNNFSDKGFEYNELLENLIYEGDN